MTIRLDVSCRAYISHYDMATRGDVRMDRPRNVELTKADYQALAAFRRTLRGFVAFSEQAARADGLTPRQHQALLAIKGAPGCGPGRPTLTVGEVAAALLVRPHSAVELVDRLAEIGLVERENDPRDHRRVAVGLTPRAEKVLRDLSAAHLRELGAIRPMLLELLARFQGGGE
jgi:DNA-binding MarR family transcriptional regulator